MKPFRWSAIGGTASDSVPVCPDSAITISTSDTKFMVGGFQRSLKGEDCFATRHDVIGGDSVSFILVADGHGGDHVSTYISSRVLKQICASTVDGSAAALNVACKAAFKTAHEEVCSTNFDTGDRKAGSTLTVVCVNATRGEVSAWNVGDSMALLVENDGYIELGVTHHLEDNQQEQERVVAKGATLGRAMDPSGQPGGPIRAFPGGLAVTRGIGDADCLAFVSAEPSFYSRRVHPMGGALVVCSDGVWDNLSAHEVATVLISGGYSDGKKAAAKVVKAAISKRGLSDDTTACVILFGPSLDGSKEGHRPHTVEDGSKSGGQSFLRRVKPSEDRFGIEDEDSGLPGKGREASVKAATMRSPSFVRSHRSYAIADASDRTSFLPIVPHGEISTDGAAMQVIQDPRSGSVIRPTEHQFVSWDEGSVRNHSSMRPRSVSYAETTTPPLSPSRSKVGPPLLTSSRVSSTFSLAGLYDRVVLGGLSSRGGLRTFQKTTQLFEAQHADGDGEAAVPWAASQSMKTRPMRKISGELRRGWRSDNALHADGDKSHPAIRNEESDLRGAQLRVQGKLPKQVREVEWTSLGEMKYLGQGEFATAHMTTLDGEKVAIKMLTTAKQNSTSALNGIKREIMMMTKMDHPNVLNAIALGQREGKPFVIIELLATVLNKELPRDPDTVPFWVRWREVEAWPLMRALNCGLQLARALQYCHDDAFPGYRVLHRDVKPNNIGFLATGELVLFDFGLASLWRVDQAMGDLPRPLTGECGSMRYMSPEVANSQDYNHKAEVYSFASVLWEMCSHTKPFTEFSSPELFKKAVANGFHPKINPKWPADLQSLLKDCWAVEIPQRPEFCQVVPVLEQLLQDEMVAAGDKKKALNSGFGYPNWPFADSQAG